MRFAHFFVDRPIFASVTSIVFLILGFVAYESLPVSQYPEIVPPTVTVRATIRDTTQPATIVAALEPGIDAFVKARILDPLGMTSTFWQVPAADVTVENDYVTEASGYTILEAREVNDAYNALQEVAVPVDENSAVRVQGANQAYVGTSLLTYDEAVAEVIAEFGQPAR